MQLFHWLLATPLIDDWSSTRYTLGDFDNPSNAFKNSPEEKAFLSFSPLTMSSFQSNYLVTDWHAAILILIVRPLGIIFQPHATNFLPQTAIM